jgi:hypothetical protein
VIRDARMKVDTSHSMRGPLIPDAWIRCDVAYRLQRDHGDVTSENETMLRRVAAAT